MFILLAKEIISDLIRVRKRVNIREWEKKSDFIQMCAKSVLGYENRVYCLCCAVGITCAGGGANDVLKHRKLRNALKGKNESTLKN